MIDLSNAQLEANRAFHFFHENLNTHVKVSIASATLLVTFTCESIDERELGNLIRTSHPAWNAPPVHAISLARQKSIYGATSAFAVVAAFSALDDFISGIEADLSKFAAFFAKPGAAVRTDGKQLDESDRLVKLYLRNGWDLGAIEPYLPVLRYFRLARDCIAHRSSRASETFAEASRDEALAAAISPLLERTTSSHPTFEKEDTIFLDPTLALTCSDVLRRLATDCNKHFINVIGVDGFLFIAAQNLMSSDRQLSVGAFKTPEALLNAALRHRYRARVSDKRIPAAELRRLGIWRAFATAFECRKARP